MPTDSFKLKTKKPPEENPQGVNNNYNKVVGKHTSKITSRGAATHPQLINDKDIT